MNPPAIMWPGDGRPGDGRPGDGRRKFDRRLVLPMLLGSVATALAAGLSWISNDFSYGSVESERPFLGFLVILAALFGIHLAAWRVAAGMTRSRDVVIFVLGVATLMRLVLVFSHPIQEVDLYRYIWDGAVVGQGISPYSHSPEAVIQASQASPKPTSSELVQLQAILNDRPGLAEVLSRVHYPQYTTVYPPVSQAIFGVASWCTPTGSMLTTHVWVMKAFLVAFDLAVIVVLMRLLLVLGQPIGGSVLYAWSPLVLKEFANSGHLDSIAVLFTLVSVLCLVLATRHASGSRVYRISSAITLALGVGAKLFPVVLAPLMVVLCFARGGVRDAAVWLAVFAGSTVLCLSPMFWQTASAENQSVATGGSGLTAFLSHWEMNDLIFMVIEENVRPDADPAVHPKPWFVFFPASWRSQIVEIASSVMAIDAKQIPFVLARMTTLAVFGMVVIGCCVRLRRRAAFFPEACFLVIAWFWMLAPTQNPWYWTWALALLPFATNRAWLAVGGLALLYYARFWFHFHQLGWEFMGIEYVGVEVFDYVVVWIEFLPVLVMLVLFRCIKAVRGG